VGAGAITIIGWLAEVVLKREAMGFGDSTLMAMVGAALGPERALATIFAGAFVGAVTFLVVVAPVGWLRARRRGEAFAFPEVPFGVFLAPAALLVLLWGTPLITWYLNRTFPEPVCGVLPLLLAPPAPCHPARGAPGCGWPRRW
jgi:leader peptidase (prepilin peptidase)/N-methyltransferase